MKPSVLPTTSPSMRDFLSSLFGGSTAVPEVERTDGKLLAAAALLVEAARLDGLTQDVERQRIAQLLRQRFSLEPPIVARLIEAAEAEADQSTGLHAFTSVIKDGFDHAGRIELMEMLWEVVLADGEVHDYEASLMRRVAGLLYVPDGESADARRRVVGQLGGAGSAVGAK